MNELIQNKSLLIASDEALKNLAERDAATVLVISDIHGAFGTLLQILEEFQGRCDALVFAGDGIRDIGTLYDAALSSQAVRAQIPPVVGIVLGNNDVSPFPVKNPLGEDPYYMELKVPLSNTMDVAGRKIFFTHGHRFSLYAGVSRILEEAENRGADIAVFGHTHVPVSAMMPGKIYTLNPGSISLPRSSDPPSFAVLNLDKNRNGTECIFYAIKGSGIEPFFPSTKYLF